MLTIKSGPLAGRRVDVAGDVTIGRENADLVIDDSEISRRHAVVRMSGGALQIEDLGSLNGTTVNGRRITGPTALAPGDSIQIGDTVFEVDAVPADRSTKVSTPPRATQAVAPQAAQAPPPPPGPPAPPPPAPVVPSPQAAAVAPPASTFAPPAGKKRARVATRRAMPTVVSFGGIIATAGALVWYFIRHVPAK